MHESMLWTNFSGFLTAGGEKIVVHGGNFGADDSKIDAVTFGPSGYEYQTCDVDGAYGESSAAPMGKLTRGQIEKGQAVLAAVRAALESGGGVHALRRGASKRRRTPTTGRLHAAAHSSTVRHF